MSSVNRNKNIAVSLAIFVFFVCLGTVAAHLFGLYQITPIALTGLATILVMLWYDFTGKQGYPGRGIVLMALGAQLAYVLPYVLMVIQPNVIVAVIETLFLLLFGFFNIFAGRHLWLKQRQNTP